MAVDPKVHMVFFPQPQGGHLLPVIDAARIFASHGAKVTIVLTPQNALNYQNTISRDQALGHDIDVRVFKLPTEEVGLPEGVENQLSTTSVDMTTKLYMALMKLQDPLKEFLKEVRPDCLVSDMLLPWTLEVANEVGIPRITAHVYGCYPLCAEETVMLKASHTTVASDCEKFTLPGLPDEIEYTKAELPEWTHKQGGYALLQRWIYDCEAKSYGSFINNCYEAEADYADYYKNVLGRRAWHIGPVSLVNKGDSDKTDRGSKADLDRDSILSWLDSQQSNSVLYISFGSMPRIAPKQLLEIAYALQEVPEQPFVWAVGRILKSEGDEDSESEEWLPEGFEEKLKRTKRGLIIRGWAPQLLIIQHPAVGGWMNHCGWNAVVECMSAGLPMITWPLSSDHFYNEKYVNEVLKVGIPVGNERWASWHAEPTVTVNREKVVKAVRKLMGSEEEGIDEMRKRSKEFAEIAKRAVDKGGSSYDDVDKFIDEMRSRRKHRPE